MSLVIVALSRPWAAVAVLGSVTLACAALEVALRPRCGICGARVRVPLEAHWEYEHAGEGS